MLETIKNKYILWLVIFGGGIFTLIGASILKSQQAEFSFDPPPSKYDIRSERNIMVAMRDGVKLATDLWFPVGVEEKLPAILVRTPYKKDGHPTVRFALYGYIVVAQDVRGKFSSEGTFTYLADDADDGYDTISWIVKQPWSNGSVGTYGCSYPGENQIVLAKKKHPNHTTMILEAAGGAIGSANQSYRYLGLYEGGVFGLAGGFNHFISYFAKDKYDKGTGRMDRKAALRSLPLIDMIKRVGGPKTDWEDIVSHDLADPFWDEIGYITDRDRFDIPALHINSWFDYGVSESLYFFNLLQKNADSDRAKENQRILIFPTTHCDFGDVSEDTKVGTLELGDARFGHFKTCLLWFDYWLKGHHNEVTDMPKVQLYVMGKNEWREENEWPLKRTTYTPLYLCGDGKINKEGKLNNKAQESVGGLSFSISSGDTAISYRYDPDDPVPSYKWPGAVDATRIESRQDIIVYTTPPLEKSIEITGPVKAILYVSSSAKDTDFMVKLLDVTPDGSVYNIVQGALRARYRDGFDKKVWMNSDEVYKIEVDLHATSYFYSPGHRIRLDISSSDFPNYERNLNTGGNNYDETEWVVAENKIYHSKQYPSHVLLPVIR
jgi:putative CocE/NonD family hydrolase